MLLPDQPDAGASPQPERSLVQSVKRAIDILDALASEDLGLVELGRRTGLPPSTTHRMLATLSACGYVSRRRSGQYELGYRAARLAWPMRERRRRLIDIATPLMSRISVVAKEHVNLSILEGAEAHFIIQVAGHEPPHVFGERELMIPANVSASGKVLMAHNVDDYTGRGCLDVLPTARFTRHSIVQRDRILAELRQIQQRGFGVDRQEFRENVWCVAAPILDDSDRAVAAISVSGAMANDHRAIYGDLGELVAGVALEVSALLGHVESGSVLGQS
jgi:IclR family acetate operon transcriptional repressor